MKILHLTTYLQGGAGRAIVGLAVEQRRAGHDVRVVTSASSSPGYSNYPAYLDELLGAGVDLRQVDSMFSRDISANLNVVRHIDSWYVHGGEPDLMHAHAAVPSLVALVFGGCRQASTPIVQTMHGWGVSKTPVQAAADAGVLSLVDRVVVPSEHAANLILSKGVPAERVTIVPYGVGERVRQDLGPRDQALVDEMGAARGSGTLVIACIGTVGARKNQRLLVEALHHLNDVVPALAVFIGDGEVDALRVEARTLGVTERCRIHGYSPAAREIAAAADLVVLPSQSEGQPLAVLEAYADRVLVAVSNIPELAELVCHGQTGLLFRPEDSGDLARTVARIAEAPERAREALRRRASDFARDRFTTRRMTDGYFDVYEQVRHARQSTRPILAA